MHRFVAILGIGLWVIGGTRSPAAETPRHPGEAACERGLEFVAESRKRPAEAATLRAQARKYFRIGSELGSGRAMFYYALELDPPEDTGERDRAGAALWYERAASNGVPEAAFNRALMILRPAPGEPEKPELAAVWLENAATNGMATAQNLLGRMYETGRGRSQSSQTAATYYRAAALQGLADAQFAWARMIRGGLTPQEPGVDPDSMIRAAAEKNVAEAQEALAEDAASQGTPTADAESTRWFLAAAEGGLPLSQWKLGLRLRQGAGAPVNTAEGTAWMVIASDGMNRDAIQELRQLERQMEPADWTQVQLRVTEIRKRIAARQAADREVNPAPRPSGPPIAFPSASGEPAAKRPAVVSDAKAIRENSNSAEPDRGTPPNELPEEYRKAATKTIWENFVRLHRAEARKHLADPEFDRGQATLTYRLHADGTLTNLEFAPGSTEGLFQVLLSEAIEASTPFPKWNARIRGQVGADHVDLVQKFKWDPEGDR